MSQIHAETYTLMTSGSKMLARNAAANPRARVT